MAARRNVNRSLLPYEVEELVKEVFPTMTLTDYVSVVGSEPKTRREFEESLDKKLTKDMVRRLKADPIRIYPKQDDLDRYFGFGYKPKTIRELGWALHTILDMRARNTSWLEIAPRASQKREEWRPVHTELFQRMGDPQRLERMLGHPDAPLNENVLTQIYEGGPVVEGTGKVYPEPFQYTVKVKNGRTRKMRRRNRKTRRNT